MFVHSLLYRSTGKPTLYDVLGVSEKATLGEIRDAFIAKSKEVMGLSGSLNSKLNKICSGKWNQRQRLTRQQATLIVHVCSIQSWNQFTMKKHVWQVNVLGKSPILTILPTLTNFHALFCFIWWPSYDFSWPNRNFERPSVTYCIIKAKYVSHEFYRKASMICNMNQREACFAF